MKALNKQSFLSVQDLAKMIYSTNHNLSTIDKLYGFYCEAFSFGPHKLSDAQLSARAQMSNEFLKMISLTKRQS
jgi:hypothetical protein